MSVRRYVLRCCCVTDENDDGTGPPCVNYRPFTNELGDRHSKRDNQSIELTTFGHEKSELKPHKGQTDKEADNESGRTSRGADVRTWRDEDLCFKHRRVVYCRRTSLSMTNLFDPAQVDMDEEINQCLSAAQKRCTYPPSRRKNGMKMLVGQNPLQNYRKLESDTDSSSKDSLSTSSSCETESCSLTIDQEPEVALRKTPEQSIDRNCHANKGYMYVNAKIPEEELPKLESKCPLCKAESKDSTVTLNT